MPVSSSSSNRISKKRKFDHVAAQFVGSHGNTGDEDSHHGFYTPTTNQAVMEVGDDDGEAEAEEDADLGGDGSHEHHHHHHQHHHGPQVDDALEHSIAPMAPMTPSHSHHNNDIDDLTARDLLRQGSGHASGLLYAAAAAADLRQSPSPPPPVGNTIPAPQPLVDASDFAPNPLPAQTQPLPPPSQPQPQPQPQPQQFQQASAPPPPSPPLPSSQQPQPSAAVPSRQHQQQRTHYPKRQTSPLSSPEQQATPQKTTTTTTEQMAQESGYSGFKVDSAFAKRMSRDPGQRLAEQRREGQELNLVRRSNVEALFAQIAGTEAANSCTHCKKGQGPWTVCVVYSGQMMGSCANCWFNASGSRCSFHEKSQPPQPVATHPYAVPAPLPVPGAASAVNGDHHQPTLGASGTNNSGNAILPSPAQLQAAALWNASGAVFSHDAGVKGTVQSALLQVREATPYQRALIQVEVAAKHLALKIVEAEELALELGQGGGSHDGESHAPHEEEGGDGREEAHQQQQQNHLEQPQQQYDSPPEAEVGLHDRT